VIEIKQEDLEYWLSGALEGGSNYWYLIINDYDKSGFDKKLCTIDNFAKSLLETPNFSIKIYDIENFSEDEDLDLDPSGALLGEISLANIVRGMDLMKENYRDMYDRLYSGDYDADDCDVWLQLIVMGEVVFC
jgi:hypothetical protein